MTYLDALILGILQGLTEFLPVSSSGHLVIGQALLGVKQPGMSFEITVHVGTLLAVLVYFRVRIYGLIEALWKADRTYQRRVIFYIIIGTLPAVIVGLTLKDFFEGAFSNPLMTSFMLLATGAILLSTRFIRNATGGLTLPRSVLIGIGQALAIFPGISRSGTTIAAGMWAGVKPQEAAEFSFLLAIPAIAGAAVLDAADMAAIPSELMVQYIIGFASSFVLALVAVYLVLEVVKRGRLDYFAYYCFALGGVGLYLFW